MPTILDKIVAKKKEEIAVAQRSRPIAELESRLDAAPPIRDFFTPLAAGGPIKLIAEVKKASPSKGVIRADFDPVEIAKIYEKSGATCISVLTDESFFQGSLAFLTAIRQQVGLPLLRKDFLIDEYQLVESRVAGADAVLLIAECLDDCGLRSLHNRAIELGMTPLVEFYEPENAQRVVEAGAVLIGVNNRDLRTFEVDLQHTVRMREELPEDCTLVGESGIASRNDVQYLEDAGVDAMLVGEQLMRQPSIEVGVRELLGQDR